MPNWEKDLGREDEDAQDKPPAFELCPGVALSKVATIVIDMFPPGSRTLHGPQPRWEPQKSGGLHRPARPSLPPPPAIFLFLSSLNNKSKERSS